MKKQELENKIKQMENELNIMKNKLANDFKKYATIVILAEDIKLDDYYEIKDTIKNIIGEIETVEELGKKELPYEIRKNKFGFYLQYNWIGSIENVKELEKYFKEEDNIIKFITVNMSYYESEVE